MLTLLTGSSGQGEFDKERAFNIKFPYCAKNKETFCDVFDYIANKIKLNNKINAELENMAKTLYDYWFVQFDFPDENKRPYKSWFKRILKSIQNFVFSNLQQRGLKYA